MERTAARFGPCFTCELVRHNPDYAHQPVYQDDEFIALVEKRLWRLSAASNRW